MGGAWRWAIYAVIAVGALMAWSSAAAALGFRALAVVWGPRWAISVLIVAVLLAALDRAVLAVFRRLKGNDEIGRGADGFGRINDMIPPSGGAHNGGR